MINFLKKYWLGMAILCIVAFLLQVVGNAHEVDIGQIMEEKFLHCIEKDDLQPHLIKTVCDFEAVVKKDFPNAFIIPTSTLRSMFMIVHEETDWHEIVSKSQHHGDGFMSNAVDFYLGNYYKGNRCETLKQYKWFVLRIDKFLNDSGLSNRVGFGIYISNKRSGNLIAHLDLRGKRGRWAFYRDEQINFKAGLHTLSEMIEKC